MCELGIKARYFAADFRRKANAAGLAGFFAVARRRLWSYTTPARSLGGGSVAGKFTRNFHFRFMID